MFKSDTYANAKTPYKKTHTSNTRKCTWTRRSTAGSGANRSTVGSGCPSCCGCCVVLGASDDFDVWSLFLSRSLTTDDDDDDDMGRRNAEMGILYRAAALSLWPVSEGAMGGTID